MIFASPSLMQTLSLLFVAFPALVVVLSQRKQRNPIPPFLLTGVKKLVKGKSKPNVGEDFAKRQLQQAFVELSLKFRLGIDNIEDARQLLMEEFIAQSGCRDKKILTAIWEEVHEYATHLTRGRLI